MGINSPKYAEKLLRFFLPKRDREFLLGDFEYLYNEVYEKKGYSIAVLWYWLMVIKVIPSFIKYQLFWGGVMFKNYFKIAWRNIKKQKVNSFINISGLAVGLAAVILLLLYIQHELSYDKYHNNADRIYRVAFTKTETAETGIFLPATISPLMKSRFPEIESSTRVMKRDERLISFNNRKFIESDFIFADPEIFKVFSFDLVNGNKETALANPNSIVISEIMAQKYFGEENPVGKIMRFEDKHDFQVTGVLKNIPKNSHFNINFLIPFTTVKQIWSWIDLDSWRISMYSTYFSLKENASINEVGVKLRNAIEENAGIEFKESKEIYFQPLTDIHLYSNAGRELGENADIQQIYILTSIALLILLIASFNYMNLTTAQSFKRMKEIGIRKVIGANKNQLIKQFIGESFIVTAISFGIAFTIVWFVLPAFNVFVGRDMTLNLLDNKELLLWMIMLVITVSLFAGLYPAVSITAIKPISLLGNRNLGVKTSRLRNSLIVSQFVISVILLIVTFVIKGQMDYVQDAEVGFTKDNIIVVDILDDNVSRNKDLIKTKLKENRNILAVASSSYLPNQSEGINSLSWAGKPDELEFPAYFCAIDYDFLDLYEIELSAGRKFSREFVSEEEGAVIINETAFRSIGWESPAGKELFVPRFGGPAKKMPLVGVAKDFNMLSLHESIAPFFFHLNIRYADTYLSIKTTGNEKEATLNYIKETIEQFSNSYPFIYNYFDEIFNSYYISEQKMGGVFILFAMLAIAIACMGLFGLALSASIRRTKEIGIRKVFGASSSSLAAKLSFEFAKYVVVANIIAWPLAYFAANYWLEEFAYRIAPQLWMFTLSFVMALVLALATVCYHTIKAANANPVESLRSE